MSMFDGWIRLVREEHRMIPSQVPIKGYTSIGEKVKQKLNTNSQVALFSFLEKDALRPGLTMKELLKTADQSSLFVKLIPATQDSIASKTLYIRDIDEECQPLDSYFVCILLVGVIMMIRSYQKGLKSSFNSINCQVPSLKKITLRDFTIV